MAQQTQYTETTAVGSDVPVGTWLVDAKASAVRFSVTDQWSLKTVHGSFHRLAGDLAAEAMHIDGALTIDAGTVDTGNRLRDWQLRTSKFFDVKRHPEVVFRTVAVTPREGGLAISGDLAIGKANVRLQLPVDVSTDARGLRLRATGTVDRNSMGLTTNPMGMVGREVTVDVDLRLVQVPG